MNSVKKLTVSGIMIATYVNLMYLSQFLSFGQFRIRIADCAYSLCYVYPFLVVPMGLANAMSCLFAGGLGPVDMFGWTLAGTLTAAGVCLIKRLRLGKWLTMVPVIIVPGLSVPIWWSYLLHIPYPVIAFGICLEQIIPALMGVLLLEKLEHKLPRLQ